MVCEGFNCLPSQAIEELEKDQHRVSLRILGLRSYRDAKAAIDRYEGLSADAKKNAEEPNGRMVDLVYKVAATILRRRVEEREEDQS